MNTWEEIVPHLARATRVALDLEGDFNLYRYGRRICLFQLAFEDGSTFLLDPLESDQPLTICWPGWKEFLENPQITKVIWAAQNDVRVLKFCHNTAIRGLFDLFDAARLTVLARPSLPLLVRELLGIEIEKQEALQTSDWNQRPLTPAQAAYAAQDVAYLLPLADQLRALLSSSSKEAAFLQRMAVVEGYTLAQYEQPWTRSKGAGILSEVEMERLKSLWLSREACAQRLDIAPWRLCETEILVQWARTGQAPAPVLVDQRWIPG